MEKSIINIKNIISQKNIKTIRLLFCDIEGNLKGIEYSTGFINRIFDDEISIDGYSIKGFQDVNHSPLYLKPDLKSFFLMEENGDLFALIFCYLMDINHNHHPCCSRYLLEQNIKRAKKIYDFDEVKIGFELEFYLLNKDGSPLDNGGYLDIGNKDKGYKFREFIYRKIEKLGYRVEAAHHECGPGQQEIHYLYKDAEDACDKLLLLKYLLDFYAPSFDVLVDYQPKPLYSYPGNGLHTNISLWKNNINLFYDKETNKCSSICLMFTKGLLRRIQGMFYVLNSKPSSYLRLNSVGETPINIGYSYQSRQSLIRIIESSSNTTRIEVRNTDAFLNPYISFSILLCAGVENIVLNKSINGISKKIPTSLKEAYLYFSKSKFVKEILGEKLFNQLLVYK